MSRKKIISCFLGSRISEVKKPSVFQKIVFLLQQKKMILSLYLLSQKILITTSFCQRAKDYNLLEGFKLEFVHGKSLEVMARSSLAL